MSVDSLKALCTKQQHPRDGLELLLAHLRDEVDRAGRSQMEVQITAENHDPADDILLIEEQMRDDKEMRAIVHDLAEMIRAVRRKLAAAEATYKIPPQAEPLEMAAEDQAPYGQKNPPAP